MISWFEPMLEGEVDPILDVGHEDQRAHRRSELVMRIVVRIGVLDEVLRLAQLADVVKVGPRPAHRGIGSDGFRCTFRELRDHQAVVMRPGAS